MQLNGSFSRALPWTGPVKPCLMGLVAISLGRLDMPMARDSLVFRRLLAVVVLLALQSTTSPGATYMHTMATLAQGEDQTVLNCSARSAEVCGLREFYVRLHPPVGNLGHFHQQTQPPRGSSPDPNTRFPPGTFPSSRARSPSDLLIQRYPDGATAAESTA